MPNHELEGKFTEVSKPQEIANAGIPNEFTYIDKGILDREGKRVFSVSHYDAPDEGYYYVAQVPTTQPLETVFDQADVLLNRLREKGVPSEGEEYDWSADVEDTVIEETSRQVMSLREFKELHPGDFQRVRFESPHGTFVYEATQSVPKVGVSRRVAFMSNVDAPDEVTDFLAKSSGTNLPKESVKKQLRKPEFRKPA